MSATRCPKCNPPPPAIRLPRFFDAPDPELYRIWEEAMHRRVCLDTTPLDFRPEHPSLSPSR